MTLCQKQGALSLRLPGCCALQSGLRAAARRGPSSISLPMRRPGVPPLQVLACVACAAALAPSAENYDYYGRGLAHPPVPTNYSVTAIVPRRIPVSGIGPDGKPQTLTVIGKNFSSLAGLPLYCWLSESNCGWHWTLVMNYLNTTARLINDTAIECPAPPFPLGGRATISVFPDRPYMDASDASGPGLRAAAFTAAGVKKLQQPTPSVPQPPGYSLKMAACVVQDLSVADAMNYEGYSNPWAEPLSVGVEYLLRAMNRLCHSDSAIYLFFYHL